MSRYCARKSIHSWCSDLKFAALPLRSLRLCGEFIRGKDSTPRRRGRAEKVLIHRRTILAVALLLSFIFLVNVSLEAAFVPLQRTNPSSKQLEAASAAQDQDDVIRVSTDLVVVNATVLDKDGKFVPRLKRTDFRIFEDGVEQNLSYFASVEKPFTVALLLDVSGSTQFQLAQIRDAANTFVNRLRPNDRLMAITFDGRVNLLTEPESVSTIRRGKLHIPAVTDGTVLYDAVDFALQRMAGIPGRKAIVLMTDGVDQNSRASLKSTLSDIAEQDMLVYAVQYNTLPQLPQRQGRQRLVVGTSLQAVVQPLEVARELTEQGESLVEALFEREELHGNDGTVILKNAVLTERAANKMQP